MSVSLKKKSIFIGIPIILLISLILWLLLGHNLSVVGNWEVSNYDIDGTIIPKDGIAEYMGDVFSRYNDTRITFTQSGRAEFVRPDYPSGNTTIRCNYSIDNNTVELFNNDNPDFLLLTYSNGLLLMNIDDSISIVFQRNNP